MAIEGYRVEVNYFTQEFTADPKNKGKRCIFSSYAKTEEIGWEVYNDAVARLHCIDDHSRTVRVWFWKYKQENGKSVPGETIAKNFEGDPILSEWQ